MTIYEFCNLCIEPSLCKLTIYDSNVGEDIFMGTMEDAMESKYADYEVDSFDVPNLDAITVNVSI